MLTHENRHDVIAYRIEKAHKCLEEAKAVADLNFWNLAGNRLYYAIFHVCTALLLDKGLSAKTHAGVIHLIGSKFVATGLLNRDCGRLISRLYELRQSGDYDDLYDATEEEILPYIEKVANMIKQVEALINTI